MTGNTGCHGNRQKGVTEMRTRFASYLNEVNSSCYIIVTFDFSYIVHFNCVIKDWYLMRR